MKVNNKSVSVAALISATLAVAAIAPQAAIAAPKKAAKAPSARTMERQIQTEKRAISKEDARISNLENELTDLRSQLSAQKAADADVAAKQTQLESQFAAEAAKENAKNNLVFFRGGFAQTAQVRFSTRLLSLPNGRFGKEPWFFHSFVRRESATGFQSRGSPAPACRGDGPCRCGSFWFLPRLSLPYPSWRYLFSLLQRVR